MDADQVVQALASGRAEAVHAAFSASFAAQVSAGEVAEVWGAALEQFGAFRAAENAVVLYDLHLRFERGDAHLQIVYQGPETAGLVLRPGGPTARFGE